MKYRVEFRYQDYVVTPEEEYDITRTATRYFACYARYADFIQELDMAGDETTVILSEESVSDNMSELYVFISKIINFLGGWRFKPTRKLFYFFMHKALIPLINNDLCYVFDNKYLRHIYN